MAQTIIRRAISVEASFKAQANTREICGERAGTGDSFFSDYIGFPLSVLSFQRLNIICFI